MKIAYYNQMFGLDGTSFIKNLIGHFCIHILDSGAEIEKRTDIERTIKIIKKSKPDLAIISEVLTGQERKLISRLKKIGYLYFSQERGHITKFRKAPIQILLASKVSFKKKRLPRFPIENKMGRGGEVIHIYLPKEKLNLISVHLACSSKKILFRQLNFLKEYIQPLNKAIIIGDFNAEYPRINPFFKDLRLISKREKTCSLTPLLNLISYKDLDQVLAKNINCSKFKTLKGFSDHKLIQIETI